MGSGRPLGGGQAARRIPEPLLSGLGSHDVMPHWGPSKTSLLLPVLSRQAAAALPTAGSLCWAVTESPPFLEGGDVSHQSQPQTRDMSFKMHLAAAGSP